MFSDIHAHVLPFVDDGPKNIEESVSLAKVAYNNGISRIIATPHFYTDIQSFEERVKSANDSMEAFKNAVNKDNIVFENIALGYEVSYFDNISASEDTFNLTMNHSGILLLELKNEPVTERTIRNIEELIYSGYTVVLAHLERFSKLPGFKLLFPILKKDGVIVQINSSSVLGGIFHHVAGRMIKEKISDIIATDMHSVDKRPPCMREALRAVSSKYGVSVRDRFVSNSDLLFNKIINR